MLPINLVVEYIISYCQHKKYELSIMAIQRFAYYIQACHLVNFDNSLFEDVPEAWASGPTYRFIYDNYTEIDYDTLNTVEIDLKAVTDSLTSLGISSRQNELLDAVMANYTNYSTGRLMIRVLQEDPWNNARKYCKPFEFNGEVVSHENMREFYNSKFN